MPKLTKEPLAVPVADKLTWSDAEMLAIGVVNSRTTLWRLRRDDPDFPKPTVRGRTLADDARAWLRSRRQAA